MLKDIIPPLAVGLTEVSIGHPFDTAKVLIQNKKIGGGYQLIIIIEDGSFLYAVLVCLIAPYFLCMKKQYSIQITIGYPDCCRVL